MEALARPEQGKEEVDHVMWRFSVQSQAWVFAENMQRNTYVSWSIGR